MGPQINESQRDAFRKELEPVMGGLYGAALRMTGNRAQAEDVVQDAILKAYRFFSSYKPGTNFKAWIHRILYTSFINSKREKGEKMTPLDSVAEPIHDHSEHEEHLDLPDHESRATALLEASDDRIKQAVDELPEDLRMTFLLSTVEGLKYREIAEVMDCPLGTVMSRLHRSRRILQNQLADLAAESGFGAERGDAQ